MKIILSSKILEITKIIKKSGAKGLQDLKIGDRIQLSIPVEPAGRNKGTYASYIEIKNLQTSEVNLKSFNQIGRVLDNFEFNEIDLYKEISEKLWDIIDDIDTGSDIFKPNNLHSYKGFYDYVMKKQKLRHEYLVSDGYDLSIK